MTIAQAADGHKDGQEQLEVVKPLMPSIEEARDLVDNGQYEEALHFLTQIIEVIAHMITHDAYDLLLHRYVHGMLR